MIGGEDVRNPVGVPQNLGPFLGNDRGARRSAGRDESQCDDECYASANGKPAGKLGHGASLDLLPCIPPSPLAGKRRIDHMERAVPILPADDITAARQFYVDKLGFRVSFEASDGTSGIMGVERG